MILIDETSFYSLIGIAIVASILAIALILVVALTKDVTIPCIKAYFRGKYLLFVLDKTGRTRIIPAEFKHGVASVQGSLAMYIKKDFTGSYNLGTFKVDFATTNTAELLESEYLAAAETMKYLGIESPAKCAALLTQIKADEGNGIQFPNSNSLYEILEHNPDLDQDILAPAFTVVKLSALAKWSNTTPEDIRAYTEEEKAEIIKQVNAAAGYKKPFSMNSGTIMFIMIVVVLGIVGLMVTKSMGMF